MILEHVGLSQINGSLVVLDGVQNASYDEMVVMKLCLLSPSHISIRFIMKLIWPSLLIYYK